MFTNRLCCVLSYASISELAKEKQLDNPNSGDDRCVIPAAKKFINSIMMSGNTIPQQVDYSREKGGAEAPPVMLMM
jgi:hypothetical protein